MRGTLWDCAFNTSILLTLYLVPVLQTVLQFLQALWELHAQPMHVKVPIYVCNNACQKCRISECGKSESIYLSADQPINKIL